MSTLYMLRDHWYTANALRCVPIYSPVVVGRPIHCAYTLRDDQTELARIASYKGGCFNLPQTVTHPATNRVQRRDFISNTYRREQFKSDLPDDVNRVQFV